MQPSWQIRLWQGLACPGSWAQAAGVVALAVVAGLAFNRSNPVGLDLSSAAPAAGPGPKVPAGATTPSLSASQAPLVAPKLGDLAETAKKAVTTRITWAEVRPLLESHAVVLVDARPAAAFAAGHIPGAVSLPEKSAPSAIAAFAVLHAKNQRIVTYCSDKSCSASMRLAQSLTDLHGFQAVQFMPGGFQEWQREQGLAVEADASSAAGATSGPQVHQETATKAVTTRITWAEVKPLLESHAVLLVDARPAAAFAAGHVPGAVSLPEKSAPSTIAAFAALHAKDQRIVTYCSDKSCSASMRLAQSLTDHHGFLAVQFMPGGYQEWQRDQGLAR